MYHITKKNDSDFLMHHGIIGMHWGIRRYQNPDGTLTEEGKQRYRTNLGFKTKVDNLTRKDTLKSKGVKGLTNYIARQYMNKAYLTGNKLSEEDAVMKARENTKIIRAVIGVAGGVSAAALSIAVPQVYSGMMAYNRVKTDIENISQKEYAEISARIAEQSDKVHEKAAAFEKEWNERHS